jgi:hypothetical protein
LYGQHFLRTFPKGLNIGLTVDPPVDLPIPGVHDSFPQLHRAPVLSELDALTAAHLFAIHLHLLSGLPQSIRTLEQVFEEVLRRFHV